MALWDEGADAGAMNVEKQSVTYQRRKKSAHAGRRPLSDHLPVDEVIVEPEEDTALPMLAVQSGRRRLRPDRRVARQSARLGKKGKTHQGYMWVYRNPVSGLILFEYRKGRGTNGVLERIADHLVNRLGELLPGPARQFDEV